MLAPHVAGLTEFFQVVVIDLTLAGDNAVVIGLAAAGLPASQRPRAILIGIFVATAIRIAFSLTATQLLQIVGLLLAGGILLLWVCWKMWRELHHPAQATQDAPPPGELEFASDPPSGHLHEKSMASAVTQIVAADISMSLDNVLAVAGAARDHPTVLIFGLALSVALMGLAATAIAGLLQKYHWIAYIGLAIILYIALEMIVRGGGDLMAHPGFRHMAAGALSALFH